MASVILPTGASLVWSPARESSAMTWRQRWFPNGEWVLLLVLAGEILFFSAVAPSFFTLCNFFEITRFSV